LAHCEHGESHRDALDSGYEYEQRWVVADRLERRRAWQHVEYPNQRPDGALSPAARPRHHPASSQFFRHSQDASRQSSLRLMK
jgi:hypothetical protein